MNTQNPTPRKTNRKQAKEVPAASSPKREAAPRDLSRGKSRSPSKSSDISTDAPLSDRDQMRNVLDALRAAQRGEFSVRLALDTGGGVVDKVAGAFNNLMERNEALANEMVRIGRVVGREGKMTERAWIGDAKGGWAECVGAINALIGDLVQPTTEVARVISTLEAKLEQRLRSLTDLMPLCLWVAQPDGKVYYTNEVWQSYSGLTPDQSTDLGLTAVHPEDRERVRLGWRNAVQQGAHFEMEYRLRRRSDGVYRWHLGRAMPERDEQKRILSWIITATDIDDLKRVQQERSDLLEAERKARRESEVANRTKDEFLASVSHELRTPLNAILGWARMLRSGMIETPKVEHALEIIERNAQAQKELIEDILDVSRIINGKLRLQTRRISWPMIVSAALDTVRPAAEAKQIQLEPVFEEEELEAAGDPDRLQQVIWNLLSNAIKFTPSGGHVRVQLRLVEGEVEVQVSDNGRGISADFLPYVFNSFRQADSVSTRIHGGLGLGLTIVRHLVELHGGTVVAASPGEGLGATFTVRLPRRLIREDLPEPSWLVPENIEAGKSLDIRLDGVRVLFVDDQPDARELVKELLELHGASVTVAETADEALQALRQRKIHVLLSDIGLPLVDGYELIRKVRELPADGGGRIPAVAVTGFARAEDSQRALSEGFQNHLSKPIEPMELVQLVATLSAGTT